MTCHALIDVLANYLEQSLPADVGARFLVERLQGSV